MAKKRTSNDANQSLDLLTKSIDAYFRLENFAGAKGWGEGKIWLTDPDLSQKTLLDLLDSANLIRSKWPFTSDDLYHENRRHNDLFGPISTELLTEVAAARKEFTGDFNPSLDLDGVGGPYDRPWNSAFLFASTLMRELSKSIDSVDFDIIEATAKGRSEEENDERLLINICFLVGRLSALPRLDSDQLMTELSREVRAIKSNRKQGKSWYVLSNADPTEELTENDTKVYNYLMANPNKSGKEISTATGIPQASISRWTVPKLKAKFGLTNIKGKGYYIPAN